MYYKPGAPAARWTVSASSSSRPRSRRASATSCSPGRCSRPQRNARNKKAIQYDHVVLDAPPTGRITQFLNVNNELAGLAKVGPIKSQADTVMTLFRSPRTVHLVTVLEEMPVQETADGIAELRKARLPVGGVVVNHVRPQDLDDEDLADAEGGTLDPEAIRSDLKKAGVDEGNGLVDALLGEARDHAERALEDAQRAIVAGLGVPTYELPAWPAGSTSAACTSWLLEQQQGFTS